MLTNNIPIERMFHNDKMWYSFEGYDSKNRPIIKEVPHGSAMRGGDGKHFYFSDDRDELYNHWVDNFNEKDEYEKLTDKYSKLINEIKDKVVKNECYYAYAPFFQYHIAFFDAKRITLEELSDKIAHDMDKVVKHLRVGMVMSEWGNTAWHYLITKFRYNRKTRVLTINTLPFLTFHGYVHEEEERVFDLKTKDGIRDLGRFMEFDRGYWQDLRKLVDEYQEKIDKQTKFINSVKKLINNG